MHPKQTVVYDGMLFSQKKEWNSDTCYNIDKLWNMMLRERNQIPKVTYIYFFVHSFSSLFFFKYSFICLCQVWYVCGIWFHDQGWNPGLLYWELRVLASQPPGKSPPNRFCLVLLFPAVSLSLDKCSLGSLLLFRPTFTFDTWFWWLFKCTEVDKQERILISPSEAFWKRELK